MTISATPLGAPPEPRAMTERMVHPGVRVLDRYRIDHLLNVSPLRARALATDLWLGRTVLVEIYAPRHVHESTSASRFLLRLRQLDAIRGPAIPRLLDGGLDTEFGAVVVMASVTVPTLRSLLSGAHTIPLTIASSQVLALAQGLQAAHNAGIVHGRVTADNVHIDPVSEQAWILGWLDSAFSADSETPAPLWSEPPDASLAPEVRSGGSAGVAADVYGVGGVLLEMLTGEPPHLRSTVESRISSWMRPVLERALATQPGDRWASMDALASAIRRASPTVTALRPEPSASRQSPTTVEPRPTHMPQRARSSRLVLLGAVVGFSLVALGLTHLIRDIPLIQDGVAVTIPSTLGRTVAEAKQIASAQNMEVLVVGERESDRYPAGQIMRQSPVPGWRPYDKQPLRVTVSTGVLVPDFLGKPFADAARDARQLGWRIARVEPTLDGNSPATTVILQSPAPGSLVPEPGEMALVIAQ